MDQKKTWAELAAENKRLRELLKELREVDKDQKEALYKEYLRGYYDGRL